MADTPNDQPDSLAERIKTSPIHNWADMVGIEVAPDQRVTGVDGFLGFIEERTLMPEKMEEPFHELLILRGKFDPTISDDDVKTFGREARELTIRYELQPMEAQWLMHMLFIPVQAQWVEFCTDEGNNV